MDCPSARQRWHDGLDQAQQNEALEAHLAGCRDCRRYVIQMERLVSALDDLHEETDCIVGAKIEGERSDQTARTNSFHAWLVHPGVRAAALIALVVGVTMLTIRSGTNVRVMKTPTVQQDAEAVTAFDTSTTARTRLSLRGDSRGRYLVVAKPSTRDDVRMYWLYPRLEEPEP